MSVRWLPIPGATLAVPFLDDNEEGVLARKLENGEMGGKGEGRVGHSMQGEL